MKIDVVGIRLVKEREIEYKKSINNSTDMINIILNEIKDLDREMVMTLNLDIKNCVLNAHVVSVGSLNSSIVDVKSIMKSALLSNAAKIMMFHNHPSGNCMPSQADNIVTEKLKSACEVMDLEFLDHIIITPQHYYSYQGNDVFQYDEYEQERSIKEHDIAEDFEIER